jgi:hypothetical protein
MACVTITSYAKTGAYTPAKAILHTITLEYWNKIQLRLKKELI